MSAQAQFQAMEAERREIRQLLALLKTIDSGQTLQELITVEQSWLTRLTELRAFPQRIEIPEVMMLCGTTASTWPVIVASVQEALATHTTRLNKLNWVMMRSVQQNMTPYDVLDEDLAQARARRAQLSVPTRRKPPQEPTQQVPVMPCIQPYLLRFDQDKPQIEQFEDKLTVRGPGPAEGVPVVLQPAADLQVRDALQYVAVYKSWANAFGVVPQDLNQPALDQALNMARAPPFASGATPVYVLDGANIFNPNQRNWDIRNSCATTFVNAGNQTPGPVVIVMQHHILVTAILQSKSGALTDDNLKHLDLFLCNLHGSGQFPVIIMEIHPEQCQDTMLLSSGKGGEFPCMYNDRSKEYPKKPDGSDYLPTEPGYGLPPIQKRQSACRVWTEEEDKVFARKPILHDFCEFDDAIVDRFVERTRNNYGEFAFRVSADNTVTAEAKRRRVWEEMPKLAERLRVRLYTLVRR